MGAAAILMWLTASSISQVQVERIAALAEQCVHKPYPYAVLHVLESADDAQTPRELYPAFYGCFDWHSSVHGHWLLARVAHLYPDTPMAGRAKRLLGQSFSAQNLAAELSYLQKRPAFERPYGLAWLLQLGAELREWPDPQAALWSKRLAPLEEHAAQVFIAWLAKSSLPVRVGTHAQSAFALGLAHDWATLTGHVTLLDAVEKTALRFYAHDRNCPVAYEPSGHDFLSPCLGEADLMRRVLTAEQFVPWLEALLATLDAASPLLQPAVVSDPSDGHIVHLDGLNLSRAWMMQNIVAVLPPEHRLATLLGPNAELHAEAGLASVIKPTYAGGHWLGSFALYLITGRGR